MLCPIDEISRDEEGENKRKKKNHMELDSRWNKFLLLTMRVIVVVFRLSLVLSRSLLRTRRFPSSVTKDKCLFSPFKLSKKTTTKPFVFERKTASADDNRII